MNILSRSIAATATLCLVAAVLVSSPTASASEPGRPGLPASSGQSAPVSRGLIVRTTTRTPSAALLRATDAVLGQKVGVAQSQALTGKTSLIGFDRIVATDVAARAAAVLSRRSDVIWAIPDSLRHATAAPPVPSADTWFPSQRNLWDTTIASPAGGYGVKAPALWRKTKGSADVIVAVLDTGVRTDDPELSGQLVQGYDMVDRHLDGLDPGDWRTTNQCPYAPSAAPSSWHGTFVANEIAAKAGDNASIAGVAPGVRVQPVRVLGHCGGWDSDIIDGITWASGGNVLGVPDNTTPAKVINLSLGYTYTAATATERDDVCNFAYGPAVTAARARGTVVVAAAGNDGTDANLAVPASCPGVVSVGATSLNGFSSFYSNIGTSVDLVAPGGDTTVEGAGDSIISRVNRGTQGPVLGSFRDVRHEGTSMAAPEAAAGAALLYSLLPAQPDAGTAESAIEKALLASVAPFRARSKTYAKKAVRLGGRTYYFDLNCAGHTWCGRGMLDLSKVQASLKAPTIAGAPVVGETVVAGPGVWLGGAKTFTYQWLRDGSKIVGATTPTYTVTPADIGHSLSVRVAPATAAYSAFSAESASTSEILKGPDIALTGLTGSRYGVAGSADVTLSNGSGTVDGPVELRRGSTVLASGTTVNGTVHLVIPGTMWIGGTNNVRAAFLGNGTDAATSTSPQPVTVAKASSTITTAVPSSARTSTHAAVRVAVKVAGVADPLGAFVVYDGTRKILGGSFTSTGRGVRTVSLPRLAKGKHHIKVVYAGNGNIIGKTSSTRVLTVR